MVVGPLEPPLGLGDDLLGDDDDVSLPQPAGTFESIADERCEVVAGLHLGDPFERKDRDHSGNPVTLTPAFVL